jgi:hypothetical protein
MQDRKDHDTSALRSWLFSPFLPSPGRETRSAVVAICDRHHIRDVQSQVKLARFLSAQRYPDTIFHHIPLSKPNWGPVEFHNLNAVCFIGRPSMFRDCDVVRQLEKKKSAAKFGFPLDDDLWRGVEVTEDSARAFHHLRENRPVAGPYAWLTVEEKQRNRRIDYALVQRFRIDYGGKTLWIVVLAGATSLGTFAAAEWVTSPKFPEILLKNLNRAGLDADESTELEVLLEVAAVVHEPAQPWVVEFCTPKRLFLNGGVNLLHAPTTITLGVRNNEVCCVLLDEDEVAFRGRAYAALIALCRKSLSVSNGAVGIRGLLDDTGAWPDGVVTAPSNLERAKGFFNDNLRKHRLRDALSIDGDNLVLHCHVRQQAV